MFMISKTEIEINVFRPFFHKVNYLNEDINLKEGDQAYRRFLDRLFVRHFVNVPLNFFHDLRFQNLKEKENIPTLRKYYSYRQIRTITGHSPNTIQQLEKTNHVMLQEIPNNIERQITPVWDKYFQSLKDFKIF